MRTPKYTALIITRDAFFVNADGTPMTMTPQPSEMESMLDAFKPEHERRYMYVEVYRSHGEVVGNTLNEVVTNLDGETFPGNDVVLYFTRKGGKPYQSQPVGKTWL